MLPRLPPPTYCMNGPKNYAAFAFFMEFSFPLRTLREASCGTPNIWQRFCKKCHIMIHFFITACRGPPDVNIPALYTICLQFAKWSYCVTTSMPMSHGDMHKTDGPQPKKPHIPGLYAGDLPHWSHSNCNSMASSAPHQLLLHMHPSLTPYDSRLNGRHQPKVSLG